VQQLAVSLKVIVEIEVLCLEEPQITASNKNITYSETQLGKNYLLGV
jgi:hypothetical protein